MFAVVAFIAGVCILTNVGVWLLKHALIWLARNVHGALHEEAAAYMAAQAKGEEEEGSAAIGFIHPQDKEEEEKDA